MKYDINTADRQNAPVQKKARVAAYIRTFEWDERTPYNYEWHREYYKKQIQYNPDWEFVGVYSDKQVGEDDLKPREGFNRLIEDCKSGKIDLILTKSIAVFADKSKDIVSIDEELKKLNPPVGIMFESERFCSLEEVADFLIPAIEFFMRAESLKSPYVYWSMLDDEDEEEL